MRPLISMEALYVGPSVGRSVGASVRPAFAKRTYSQVEMTLRSYSQAKQSKAALESGFHCHRHRLSSSSSSAFVVIVIGFHRYRHKLSSSSSSSSAFIVIGFQRDRLSSSSAFIVTIIGCKLVTRPNFSFASGSFEETPTGEDTRLGDDPSVRPSVRPQYFLF